MEHEQGSSTNLRSNGAASPAQAQRDSAPSVLDALEWRLIGPFRGGRVVAVAADPEDEQVFYSGSTGGVWKTTDGGLIWENCSDGSRPTIQFKTNRGFTQTPESGKFYVSTSGMVIVARSEQKPNGEKVVRNLDAGQNPPTASSSTIASSRSQRAR
jgi:hypothetical protein